MIVREVVSCCLASTVLLFVFVHHGPNLWDALIHVTRERRSEYLHDRDRVLQLRQVPQQRMPQVDE